MVLMKTKHCTDMIGKAFCHSITIVSIIVLSLFSSCQLLEELKIKKIVNQTYGRQIDPKWMGLQLLEDTIVTVSDIAKKPITIITYEEYQLCTGCLQKYLWGAEKLVEYFKSDYIEFIAIIVPREDYSEIQDIIKGLDCNKVKVICDVNQDFFNKNHLEKIPKKLNGYLLDKDHRVVVIGNPLTSNYVGDLYKKIMPQMIKDGGIASFDKR